MNLIHTDWEKPTIVTRPDGRIALFQRDKRIAHFKSGPNVVHAFILHADGSYEDLGESHNLLTNIGRDWWHDALGGVSTAGGEGSPATASSATSITSTGTPYTASNFATPQLGLAGKVIMVPITSITTTPVFGLIGSNTSSVITVDKWWTPDFAGTGTTPSSTAAFDIIPGRGAGVLFMALTTDAAAAAASDTALASEISTNGCARSKATYSHTYGVATDTIVNAFSPTGTFTAIHKMALFTCSTLTATGIMVYEAVLNVDATVASGDTLTVTDTITLSG
jgi:hypothetical protein